jgi:hypothetical protein
MRALSEPNTPTAVWSNQGWLWLSVIAYNWGNLWRWLVSQARTAGRGGYLG